MPTSKVSVPTLPRNMVKIMIHFPAVDSFAVIPSDNPTVLYADTVSKTIFFRPSSASVRERIKTATPITARDNKITANALREEI